VILLVAPVLLLVGFSTGHFTNRVLAMPDDAVARVSLDMRGFRLDLLNHRVREVRDAGDAASSTVGMYREHVAPVERVLKRRGVPAATARRVAWPLVEQTQRTQLDLATVMSIVFVESNARPDATSSVGARGLMQVMPAWSGHWRGCGRNLYDIESNLCNGTNILALYLRQHKGNERRALLGYNGCVRGTVTANCHTYPDKVDRLRRQIAAELAAARREPRPGSAASR
jgi:soluble lytic murein transglycosylase-like protein